MRRKWIQVIALIMLTFLIACSGEDDKQTDDEPTRTPVEVAEVSEGDLVIEKEVYGRTSPSKTTPIMVQNPGEIDEVNVENGDRVEKDDIIVKIKSPAGIQNVRAPEDGEVANLDVKEGDIVSNEEPLAVLIDLEKISIQFTATSDVRSLFKKDDQFTTIIDDESFKATITSIGKLPDDTGLYPIEAEVTNKDDHILPGMTAVMNVPEQRVKKSVILPTEAIIEENDETYVYIVDKGSVVKTDIKIVETQSDQTAVKGELEKGDIVVVNGQLTLSDGSFVDVVEEENES